MIKQNDDVLDGFTLGDLSSVLIPNTDGLTIPKDKGNTGIPEVDPEDLKDLIDSNPEDLEDDSEEDKILTEEDEFEEEDKLKDVDEDEDSEEGLGEYESDVSKFFMEKMAEELGWSLTDDDKFESVSDVIDYMEGIVADASQPQYASEEVATFDEFVKNGGTLRKFYENTISGTVDLEDFNLEVDENKRAIIREDLRNQGLSEKQIIRKIERYETAGVLDEEAEDSLSNVEISREKKAQKLLKDQENFAKQSQMEQQKLFNDVQSYVKTLKDIRGIPVSEVEKNKLINDIFRQDNLGKTQYQKVYVDNLAKNLIESAYFTLMGDSIIDKMKKRGQTDAAKDLKRKLKTSKSKRTKQKDNDQDLTVSGGLSLLSNQLL